MLARVSSSSCAGIALLCTHSKNNSDEGNKCITGHSSSIQHYGAQQHTGEEEDAVMHAVLREHCDDPSENNMSVRSLDGEED